MNQQAFVMKNILLIQTGGTIAMNKKDEQVSLDSEKWTDLLYQEIPELSTIADIEVERLFFEDSSDIHAVHWEQLARFIHNQYQDYDGFVILHGTDTMAYTASALSFVLQNIQKPVILTGSQVPMSSLRSDARRNLVNSIEMATLPLFEVAICFNDFVYRGNRATKMSIGDFDAFASPNYPPLAEIGINIELKTSKSAPADGLNLQAGFSDEVFLLKIYPGLNPAFLQQIPFGKTRALVVEAFGSGNFPVHGERSLLPFFKQCIKNEILLIFSSQAAYDSVELSNYESGRIALELGGVSAKDMTTEATITKLMYLLAHYTENSSVRSYFNQNLAGEITV